jgi:DNA-binding protein H-NS
MIFGFCGLGMTGTNASPRAAQVAAQQLTSLKIRASLLLFDEYNVGSARRGAADNKGFVVLYEDSTHRSPSIVAENSSTDLKSAIDFASMSVDDLWKYRESIDGVLKAKIAIELAELKRRLDLLNSNPSPTSQKRRSYPPVQPKYCNPEDQSETWAGRGNQPRWVRMQLSLGRRLEDFRIGKPGHQRRIAAA